MATIKLDPDMLELPSNRAWLIQALNMIICELEKGEHRSSLVLEIFESEAVYQSRRLLAAQEAP